jgi:hypothetical protein
MDSAGAKFRTLSEVKKWDVPDKNEAAIIAIEAELARIKQQKSSGPSSKQKAKGYNEH